MNATLLAAACLLPLATSPALAEGEGGSGPFTLDASSRTVMGAPFRSETGSAAQPVTTGSTAQGSALGSLDAAPGTEAVVETANSLPVGAGMARTGPAHAGRTLTTGLASNKR